MFETSTPRVHWIGPTGGSEFGPCHDLVTSEAEIVAGGEADLTVVTCPRPAVEVTTLEALAAKEKVVQLLGVWCEGEGRTGRVASNSERVFWHAWPAWWDAWRGRTHAKPRLVRVEAQDRALTRALIEACEAAGWAAVTEFTSLDARPSVVVWDGSQLGGREADRLDDACLRARRQGARLVALLDFPRPETVNAARRIGAAAVLGKPFDDALLMQTLSAAASGTLTPINRMRRQDASLEVLWRHAA